MAIMGFGFASFLGAPIIGELIGRIGISQTFYSMAGVYLLVMTASALYLTPPPKDWALTHPSHKKDKAKTKRLLVDLMPMNANEAVRTWPFYGLWIMMFINITCGIAIISVASPMIQEMTGVSALVAAAIVGLNGLFNGFGRLGWATISDWIGRPLTFILFFIIEIGCFLMLPGVTDVFVYQIIVYTVMTCYGGGFATLPAYIGDLFGTRQVSAIHGYVLTAWALAGVSGSSLAAFIRESTGSYSNMLRAFSGAFLFALLVSFLMLIFVRKKRKQLNAV
jgi:OFA family oxalate/formate antiporter-like MFS transporter